MRMPSGSDAPVGVALTLSVPGSSSASQMIRASGAVNSGASAKIEPPLHRVRRGAARRFARAHVPGDIIGIAPEPFPHDPGAVDRAKPPVKSAILPIASRGHALFR